MKKKIFSILLSLCMVLTMIPVATGTVWAEGTSVTIGGKTLSAENKYYHNGENGMAGTVNDSQEGANATFNSTDGTLTLNELNLTSGNISATGDLTIKLVGENTLGNENYSDNVIFVRRGNLVIEEAGSLTVKNGNNTQTTIYVGGNITIDGGANVSATHADGKAQAIHASGQGQITISGAGTKVTATHNGKGSSTDADYVALKAGTIQILNGAKLTAKGEAKAVDGTLSVNPLENYMIYAGDREPGTEKREIANLTDKYLKVEPKNAASTALENVTFGYAYDVQRSPDFPANVGDSIATSQFRNPLIGADGSRANSNEGNWKLTRVGTYSFVKNQTLNNSNQNYLDGIVNAVSQAYTNSNLNEEAIVIHELKNGDEKNGDDHIAYGVVIAYDAEKGKAVFIGDTWQGGGCYLLSTKEISADSFTIKAGQIATDFVQNISISLDPTGTYTFSEATVGYDAQTLKKTVTVTNTGNAETGELKVALSGTHDADFVLSTETISSIAVKSTEENQDGTATFTVAPREGLSTGNHTATVTVSGENIVSQSFNVSFTVNPKVLPRSIELDTTGTYTFPEATVGYSDLAAKEVKITSTGTAATGELVIDLSGTNEDSFKLNKTKIESIAVGESDTFTVTPKTGLAAGTYTAKVTVSDGNLIFGSFDVSFTVNKASSGGGSHSSSIQKPTIIAGEGSETSLSILGTNLTIKMTEGYELTDVILNGVSKGKVTELTGLRTGDKVEVKTEKKQEKPTKEEIIAALDSSKLVARSKLITLENGKKAVRVTWYDQNGNEIDFDGIEVYRSVKRYKGYGLEPFYTTKGDKSEGYYVNTKDLKEGTTYYYKVRGYVTIDGQKYYTDYSLKAIRTIK